jgi:hypothetical protein
VKFESELMRALCLNGSSKTTMKTLSECIVDGTSLPGMYSGTDASLLEKDGNENMTTQLAESFAQAINRTAGGTGITGTSVLTSESL